MDSSLLGVTRNSFLARGVARAEESARPISTHGYAPEQLQRFAFGIKMIGAGFARIKLALRQLPARFWRAFQNVAEPEPHGSLRGFFQRRPWCRLSISCRETSKGIDHFIRIALQG